MSEQFAFSPFYVNVYHGNQENPITGRGTSRKQYPSRERAARGSRYYGQEVAIYRIKVYPKQFPRGI